MRSVEPNVEGSRNILTRRSIRALEDGFQSAAMIPEQFFYQLDALTAFGPAATGGIHVLGALTLICRDGFLELAIGQRIANAYIHGRILLR
jgi:hypothetical protein